MIFVKKLLTLFLLLTALALAVYPSQAAEGALNGLRMCGTAIIPALLPFFVLTRLLSALLPPMRAGKRLSALFQQIFGVSADCLPALLLSWIGGYPVGVSTTVSLYETGTISRQDAERALCFCNNSGPAFFIAVIGARVLGSVRHGIILYLIHCLSALLVGAATARPSVSRVRLTRTVPEPLSAAQAFEHAVSSSCASLLQICALVILFSVLLQLLAALGLFRLLCALPLGLTAQELEALVCGALELSGGILRLHESMHAFVLCALFMGWGGLCVHLQALTMWQSAHLHPRGYFSSKLLHGVLSALLASAYAQKSALFLLLASSVCAVCLIFRQLRQKKGGNPRALAV